MMLRRPRVVLNALVLVTAVLAPKAWAGDPGDQLFGQIDRVLKVLADHALRTPERAPERREAIRHLAGEILDVEEISRRCLGRHWAELTASEREEFVRLFGDLLERAYIGKLEHYSGETIARLGESIDGDQAIVRTRIVTTKGAEIPVDYRLARRGDRWRAYDVVIEGISLVANYRAQFDSIIRHGSYRELVKRVRDKQ